jgi:glycosyltransferase involved in cell wall biosynthesis
MKILFLPKEFPHAKVIGGPILVYNRIKYLSKNNFIGMAAFINEDDKKFLPTIEPYLSEIRPLSYPSRRSALRKTWDFFFSSVPYYMSAYKSKAMAQALGEMTYNKRYDIIIAEYGMACQFLYNNPYLNPRTKRVMSCHECYTIARKKVRDLYGRFSRKGIRATLDLFRLQNYEFAMYRSADKVIVLTPQEKQGLLEYAADLNIDVVPHGTDTDFFSPPQEQPSEEALAFLGNYLHDPNRDAIMYFIRNMWQRITKAFPGIRLYVIGRGPTQDILDEAEKDNSIIVTGQVDDVREHLKKATLFVAPLRLGKGFRGKILEAMAMGMPVITTPLGAEGVEYKDMENMVIAENSELFVSKVLELLNNKNLQRQIGKRGRELVVNKYSYQRGVQILEDVLHKTLMEPGS